MEKQNVFVMLVVGIFLSALQCLLAVSYNIDKFTITTDDIDTMTVHTDGDYIIYRGMMDSRLHGYDLVNRQEFTIFQGDIDSMNLYVDGGFVVWYGMMDYVLYGFELATRRSFIITDASIDITTVGMNNQYVMWRGMDDGIMYAYDLATGETFQVSMMSVAYIKPLISGHYGVYGTEELGIPELHGIDLNTRQDFVITTVPLDMMSLRISPSHVIWYNGDTMQFEAFDLAGRQTIELPNIYSDSMSIRLQGDVIIWSDWNDMKLKGYNLADQEAFTISSDSVDTMSLGMNGRYVIWKDSMAMDNNLHGFDLSTNEQFDIGTVSYLMRPPSMSEDYLAWKDHDPDTMTTKIMGYDLGGRTGFEIETLSSDTAMYDPDVTGDFVIWQDYTEMDMPYLVGGRIFKVANDVCEDAIKVLPGVVYQGDSTGSTGEYSLGCGFRNSGDVWYEFTPDVGGEYTISLAGSQFDTVLALYNACESIELVCNDDYNLNSSSQLIWPFVAGKRYLIQIGGFDGQTGKYQLLVSAGVCSEPILSDLDGNCRVDLVDLGIMASQWLDCNLSIPADCGN